MKSLEITTNQEFGDTNYTFTRSKIDYTVFIKNDLVDVWKRNNQIGTLNNTSYFGGVDNQGRPMAKFLKDAVKFITS